MAAPLVTEIAKDNDVDVVYYLNIEKYSNDSAKYFEEYEIQGVPEIIYFENGEAIDKSFDHFSEQPNDEIEDAYSRMYESFFKTNK